MIIRKQYCTKTFQIPVILTGLLLLNSCSLFQNDTGYDLDKQIERQQMQYELISEPVTKEELTAKEFEDLGDRYLLRGDINRAYIYYIKGLGVEPDNVSLIHKQGTLLLKKSKFIEAEAVYEKLYAMNSLDSLALEGRGKAYFGLKKFAEAEQSFLTAVELKPDLWQSHEFLGLIYSRQQEYDQAINQFIIALDYQPHSVSIANNLAVSYYITGELTKAARLLEGLVRISNNKKIYNNLALVYCQLGFYEKALNAFKSGSDNEAVAYNNMGYELLLLGKYREAITAFEKAIEIHPKFYPVAQKNLEIARQKLADSGTL